LRRQRLDDLLGDPASFTIWAKRFTLWDLIALPIKRSGKSSNFLKRTQDLPTSNRFPVARYASSNSAEPKTRGHCDAMVDARLPRTYTRPMKLHALIDAVEGTLE